MSTLQSITDELLITAIEHATQRVVLVSPAVWPPLAKCVADAWRRLGPEKVIVILDVDSEVCRFGYGSLEGLEVLQKVAADLGQALGHEKGVRISVVIADDQTFVFAPTPRQLEAPPEDAISPSTTHPKANGIVLSKPPENLQQDLGAGPDKSAERTVGLEAVKPDKVAAISRDLKQNPPKAFDLARAVNVYNATIQFVEFKVEGCQLSQHKARLPKDLLHVVKKNKELAEKIDNSIRLLDENDTLITDPASSQDSIFKTRAVIEEKFLVHIPNVGTVMRRSDKAAFSAEVSKLEAQIKTFAERAQQKLVDHFVTTATDLATALLEDVVADIPSAWRKKLGSNPNPDRVRWFITDALQKSFGNPEGRINRMKAKTVFKDVTYEMLNEPDFISIVSEHFPDLKHIEEYTAAKERPAKPEPKAPDSQKRLS
jgi:hypothetical protein